MTKRSIQTSPPGYFVGIEFDLRGIRGARVSSDGRGGFAVSSTVELAGDFAEDENLIEGLRKVKAELGTNLRDTVLSCVSGKQVFAAQMDFRRLAGDEMEQALRLELRKIVHFEVATSALDFEILDGDGDSTGGHCQVMVALASNAVLARQIKALERSGLRPAVLDVLPMSVANALWSWRGDGGMETPCAAVHVGANLSTFVVDGIYAPFFNRYIPFNVEETVGESAHSQDRTKQYQYLAEEIARSLAYHEKVAGVSGLGELVLLGDRVDERAFAEALDRRTGLRLVRMDLASKFGAPMDPAKGQRSDLAIALALRGDV